MPKRCGQPWFKWRGSKKKNSAEDFSWWCFLLISAFENVSRLFYFNTTKLVYAVPHRFQAGIRIIQTQLRYSANNEGDLIILLRLLIRLAYFLSNQVSSQAVSATVLKEPTESVRQLFVHQQQLQSCEEHRWTTFNAAWSQIQRFHTDTLKTNRTTAQLWTCWTFCMRTKTHICTFSLNLLLFIVGEMEIQL